MENSETIKISPTEFILSMNQTLGYAYPEVMIEGEIASFKVNQGKWVFFDIKDVESSVSCFMTLYQLRMPLEDGMKVVVKGAPKITKWGKFSFTVNAVRPVGEGNIKKAFEILKSKLEKEGLFDAKRKRQVPENLLKIGVISSVDAAGYKDFIKIINTRWGGMKVQVAHTQVQGIDAPDQIIRALRYFNEKSEAQIIAILRGGGSADDLACFNDEMLVREVASSKIPVISGIGHEVDETLVDLVADVRASTPSNAAEILTKDRKEEKEKLRRNMKIIEQAVLQEINNSRFNNFDKCEKISRSLTTRYIDPVLNENQNKMTYIYENIKNVIKLNQERLKQRFVTLGALDPEEVLKRGYAVLTGEISPGSVVKITTFKQEINAEVKNIKLRER